MNHFGDRYDEDWPEDEYHSDACWYEDASYCYYDDGKYCEDEDEGDYYATDQSTGGLSAPG